MRRIHHQLRARALGENAKQQRVQDILGRTWTPQTANIAREAQEWLVEMLTMSWGGYNASPTMGTYYYKPTLDIVPTIWGIWDQCAHRQREKLT